MIPTLATSEATSSCGGSFGRVDLSWKSAKPAPDRGLDRRGGRAVVEPLAGRWRSSPNPDDRTMVFRPTPADGSSTDGATFGLPSSCPGLARRRPHDGWLSSRVGTLVPPASCFVARGGVCEPAHVAKTRRARQVVPTLTNTLECPIMSEVP